MKKHSSSSSIITNTRSSNLVLILFSLVVAFTLGFLASPISRRSSSHCFPASNTPAPSSVVADEVRAEKRVEAQKEVREEKRVVNPNEQPVAAGGAQFSDKTTGFTSRLQTLPDDLLRFHYSCRKEPQPSPSAARVAVIQEVFEGESPFTSFPPAHISRMVRRQRIKGWGSDHPVFERLIREVRPRVVVELGTFLGASAIHMSKTIQRTLSLQQEEFVIFCLDDFRGWPGFRKTFTDIGQEHANVMLLNQFLQNVAYSNATGSIVPVPFSTNTGLYKLCELGVVADLIEVDAGHDFHSAWTDINLAWSLMRPDGKSVMFGHDYFNGADYHGVRRAVDLFAKLKGLRVEPDGQHWILRPQYKALGSGLSSKKKKRKISG